MPPLWSEVDSGTNSCSRGSFQVFLLPVVSRQTNNHNKCVINTHHVAMTHLKTNTHCHPRGSATYAPSTQNLRAPATCLHWHSCARSFPLRRTTEEQLFHWTYFTKFKARWPKTHGQVWTRCTTFTRDVPQPMLVCGHVPSNRREWRTDGCKCQWDLGWFHRSWQGNHRLESEFAQW